MRHLFGLTCFVCAILIGLVIQRIRLTHLDQRLLGVVSLVLLLRIRSMGLARHQSLASFAGVAICST